MNDINSIQYFFGKATSRLITPNTLSVLLFFVGLSLRLSALSFKSLDAENFVIPWYERLSMEGFSAFSSEFSNYSPTYLYLLWIGSYFVGPENPLIGIKIVGIVVDIILSAAVAYLTCTVLGKNEQLKRSLVFSVIWCMPTAIVNSSVWAQCDALYTAALVLTIAAAIKKRSLLCFLIFGIALSTKLQAMFLSPAILLWMIVGVIHWSAMPMAALSYICMLTPAAIAGRSWHALLTIYVSQGSSERALALSAPNPWTVVPEKVISYKQYLFGVMAGLIITTSATITYVLKGTRRIKSLTGVLILESAFVSCFIVPFLLPKMHDRYFFPADVLSITLTLVDRRWWPIAGLVQFASLTAYCPFLFQVSMPLALGMLANLIVFFALIIRWWPTLNKYIPNILIRGLTRLSPPTSI